MYVALSLDTLSIIVATMTRKDCGAPANGSFDEQFLCGNSFLYVIQIHLGVLLY